MYSCKFKLMGKWEIDCVITHYFIERDLIFGQLFNYLLLLILRILFIYTLII